MSQRSAPAAPVLTHSLGCRRTPFELMDFGLESSQLVHPFSSQREFALRIVACEPTQHCAAPPLKTGPKRHTSFEVFVCSWTSTMIWTWTCQWILIIGVFKGKIALQIHAHTKKTSFLELDFWHSFRRYHKSAPSLKNLNRNYTWQYCLNSSCDCVYLWILVIPYYVRHQSNGS